MKKNINVRRQFDFGKNWQKYLITLNDNIIEEAKKSLQKMLRSQDLLGKTFLDVGCGSGLFSLSARLLGAKVHSIDCNSSCVNCALYLKEKYFSKDENWTIEYGDVLDEKYVHSLGQYDIAYCWGVLHHTGKMWKAMEIVDTTVKKGGMLYLAIYNDQGALSRRWKIIKKTYNRLPHFLRFIIVLPAFGWLWGPTILKDLIRGKPFATWYKYKKNRGMNPWSDVIDWIGGYPFEVAKPEEIFYFYTQLSYSLKELRTCTGGYGCNEYVFVKSK